MNKKKEIAENKSEDTIEKLSVWHLIQNVGYVLHQAIKLDAATVVVFFILFIAGSAGYAMLDTYLFKQVLDMIMNDTVTLKATVILIAEIAALSVTANLCDCGIDTIAQARFVLIAGKIQAGLIQKAADIDLICYDNKKYYDDFVIAAQQADDMIPKGIMAVARILGCIAHMVVAASFIFTMNPIVALFPVAGFIVNIITRFAITKTQYDYDMERQRLMRRADYSRRVFYQPEYAKEIKLSSIDIPLRRQFNDSIDEIEGKAVKAGNKIAALSLVNWITVFTILSFLTEPLYLAYLVLVKKTMTFSDMSATDNAQGDVRNALDAINYALVDFQKVGQYTGRFRRFMNYKIRIEKASGTESLPSPDGCRSSSLEIDNMSFRYEGSDRDTLSSITMTIHPGEHIAIVGENGAGKSTFIKVLMHLYDITGGSIRYGGRNICSYATEEYRSLFGAVFQDFQLYGASLAENILMDNRAGEEDGCGTSELRDQQNARLEKALDLAGFTGKYKKLSHGLDTEMTREFCDEGTMLSGGETQKVAISRMFAKHEKQSGTMAIAILDEPSSALDPQAEAILNRNMLEAAGDASVIFISHRLSTTRDADRIYLFENGTIAEQGTHDELMKRNGSYAAMFQKQAHYYQE
jgi:ATP-binding cassette, subfamily B, bacterial